MTLDRKWKKWVNGQPQTQQYLKLIKQQYPNHKITTTYFKNVYKITNPKTNQTTQIDIQPDQTIKTLQTLQTQQ